MVLFQNNFANKTMFSFILILESFDLLIPRIVYMKIPH